MELPFAYTLKRKRGMKTVRVAIQKKGTVVVSAPFLISKKRIELFLKEKSPWIEEKILFFKQRSEVNQNLGSYATHAKRAKKLVIERVKLMNTYYGFEYKRISIKQHQTRWGSCSSQKNLNFNYRLYFLPLELVDYVVVHELCHLAQMNHSQKFWALVAQQIPDFKMRRAELKKNRI